MHAHAQNSRNDPRLSINLFRVDTPSKLTHSLLGFFVPAVTGSCQKCINTATPRPKSLVYTRHSSTNITVMLLLLHCGCFPATESDFPFLSFREFFFTLPEGLRDSYLPASSVPVISMPRFRLTIYFFLAFMFSHNARHQGSRGHDGRYVGECI